MIVVLLLVFQSICRFCQRIVLHVHDRWINPKNVRLISEATESAGLKLTYFKRNKTIRNPNKISNNNNAENYIKTRRALRKKYTNSGSSNATLESCANSSGLVERDCRFCANTPQGYCRHHLHLQELQVQRQKQQQHFWNPLAVQPNTIQEYRELRKINRELRGKLVENRFKAYHQSDQQQQQKSHQNNYHYTNAKQQPAATQVNPTHAEDSGYNSVTNSESPLVRNS